MSFPLTPAERRGGFLRFIRRGGTFVAVPRRTGGDRWNVEYVTGGKRFSRRGVSLETVRSIFASATRPCRTVPAAA